MSPATAPTVTATEATAPTVTAPETSTRRQMARDLAEEAKKRVVLLLVCVFGLSFLMSLTSSSVWVNLPAAAAMIIFARYISLDLDARRRTISCNKPAISQASQKLPVEFNESRIEKQNWKQNVNSPVVEAAIEQFTRHLVSEWVTDLWYSRITPDKQAPEELVQIINGVLGEISNRARDINLIDLLTRDVINLICNHLELYRLSQIKTEKQTFGNLAFDLRDIQFRMVLAAENKLHPALFSVEAEHKVLQRLVNGLISLTFKSKDLECSFFRYTVRELLSCAVIRPIFNLINPRFVNEKIESLVLSLANKSNKGITRSAEATPAGKPNATPRPADKISGPPDHSTVGVELVQLKQESAKPGSDKQILRHTNGPTLEKNQSSSGTKAFGVHDASVVALNDKSLPLVSNYDSISRSSSSLLSDTQYIDEKNTVCNSGGEWAHKLDVVSRRKTQTLAPEHFENMWTKGRNYRKMEGENVVEKQVGSNIPVGLPDTSRKSFVEPGLKVHNRSVRADVSKISTSPSYEADRHFIKKLPIHASHNGSTRSTIPTIQEGKEYINQEEVEPDSESSCPSEDDESINVTGLDSPGIKVWDSRSNRNIDVSKIHHPLETSESHSAKKGGKDHVRHPRALRTTFGRKRSRSTNQKIASWQEVQRPSFLLGDDLDILNAPEKYSIIDDPEMEAWSKLYTGAATSPSTSSASASESVNSSLISPENSVLSDPFLKLRCEVFGANVVKSGSVTFAVYSIAVTDANNNSWSIKRRFRHFEELHRRLKEFPEYNLHLPPKHFLSSGLDAVVVQERCKLLDKYLKKLLQFPTLSGSIEVWDFLSVDSQTYMFTDSLSIIHTLPVNLENKPYENNTRIQSSGKPLTGDLLFNEDNTGSLGKEYDIRNKNNSESENLRFRNRNTGEHDSYKDDSDARHQKNVLDSSKFDISTKDKPNGEAAVHETSQIPAHVADSAIPPEWVPPNLSAPILSLVDVIFQLQDGGWIRRQAFWVAKQLLQLGMGDAFDDWLIDKIQFLRRGSVIASAIKRIEQILWPDGIFLTKHPNRKPQTPVSSPGPQKDNIKENILTAEQQVEAARREKFVRELIIDKAPATLVSLFGRKEYERCAEDIFFFLQSPLFLRQLTFELLELLLLAAFPELDDVVRQCHENKDQFGVIEEY